MDLRVRRIGAAGALAAVLLLAGCGAGSDRAGTASSAVGPAAAADAQGGAQAGAQGAAKPAAAPGKGDAAPGAGATPGGGATAAPADRRIAYQGRLTLRVDAVEDARARAVDLVTRAGGYVAGENLRGGPGESRQATLTLKVPSASYQAVLDGLGAVGTRLGLSSQADDLTDQIADVDSRLKSMQASVDRVRALMAGAKSLSEVVSLESELTRRESDLESLQRQQQGLSARVSLSTVTLELVTPYQDARVEPEKPATGFWASVGHALAGGWHALLTVVRVLLTALAAAAPFLLLLAPLGWLLRKRRRRAPKAPALPPRPAHAPDSPDTEEAPGAEE
ncbi:MULTISPECIES: DUF4349 domain-containing protein [Kitasatospora]|uniref:Putative lipoprotein n=1 Tax=Kitasatospora setae (strain ATCC 33774 / DSM 43861 / JCM 3304 / KCC A-0304 / NBRC 14216 / KM-6054) TaxID=452652 RepID=E4NIF7_KITSK|nr:MULTISPECIES: DUF4349 domain-containing protein [Kitasatospora]BAJ31287.1 putative lipoprotein [Kitasatospora setae KM-6054]